MMSSNPSNPRREAVAAAQREAAAREEKIARSIENRLIAAAVAGSARTEKLIYLPVADRG
jgi:hypothetical protein